MIKLRIKVIAYLQQKYVQENIILKVQFSSYAFLTLSYSFSRLFFIYANRHKYMHTPNTHTHIHTNTRGNMLCIILLPFLFTEKYLLVIFPYKI